MRCGAGAAAAAVPRLSSPSAVLPAASVMMLPSDVARLVLGKRGGGDSARRHDTPRGAAPRLAGALGGEGRKEFLE